MALDEGNPSASQIHNITVLGVFLKITLIPVLQPEAPAVLQQPLDVDAGGTVLVFRGKQQVAVPGLAPDDHAVFPAAGGKLLPAVGVKVKKPQLHLGGGGILGKDGGHQKSAVLGKAYVLDSLKGCHPLYLRAGIWLGDGKGTAVDGAGGPVNPGQPAVGDHKGAVEGASPVPAGKLGDCRLKEVTGSWWLTFVRFLQGLGRNPAPILLYLPLELLPGIVQGYAVGFLESPSRRQCLQVDAVVPEPGVFFHAVGVLEPLVEAPVEVVEGACGIGVSGSLNVCVGGELVLDGGLPHHLQGIARIHPALSPAAFHGEGGSLRPASGNQQVSGIHCVSEDGSHSLPETVLHVVGVGVGQLMGEGGEQRVGKNIHVGAGGRIVQDDVVIEGLGKVAVVLLHRRCNHHRQPELGGHPVVLSDFLVDGVCLGSQPLGLGLRAGGKDDVEPLRLDNPQVLFPRHGSTGQNGNHAAGKHQYQQKLFHVTYLHPAILKVW